MAESGLAAIKSQSLFEGLPEVALTHIAQECAWHSHKAGAEILTKDSSSMDVFFVVSGAVQVMNYSATGREVAYAIVEAGNYFGELAAIDQKPRSTNVAAATACRLASLSPATFQSLLTEHPKIGLRVLTKLAGIIRRNDERIMDLSTLDTHQRIYAELLRLAAPDPLSKERFMIYPLPTQQALAAHVSTTRETVARALSQLSASDIVQRKGRTLYINDKSALTDLMANLSRPKATK